MAVDALAKQVQEIAGNSVKMAHVDQDYRGDDPQQAAQKTGGLCGAIFR